MLSEDEYQLVILRDEGVLGVIISQSAHASLVAFVKNGMQYVVLMENDDLAAVTISDLGLGVDE